MRSSPVGEDVAEFRGIFVRVSLTPRNVVIAGLRERTISYEEIVDVSGGWLVGPSYVSLSDADSLLYGLRLESCRTGVEHLRIRHAARAAEIIRQRSPNLWAEARTDLSFADWRTVILEHGSRHATRST